MTTIETDVIHASVVICTRNRPDKIGTAVGSVLALDYPAFDVTVIDQSTTDDTRRALDAYHDDERLRYLHFDEAGLSRAYNNGIRQTQGEIIAFTDDDCIVPNDWLTCIVSAFQADQDGELLYGRVQPWESGEGHDLTPLLDIPVAERLSKQNRNYKVFGMGANFAARRRLFDRIGLLRRDPRRRCAVEVVAGLRPCLPDVSGRRGCLALARGLHPPRRPARGERLAPAPVQLRARRRRLLHEARSLPRPAGCLAARATSLAIHQPVHRQEAGRAATEGLQLPPRFRRRVAGELCVQSRPPCPAVRRAMSRTMVKPSHASSCSAPGRLGSGPPTGWVRSATTTGTSTRRRTTSAAWLRAYRDDHGFIWDHGGHVMFSHYTYFDELVERMLRGDYDQHLREAWVWIHGPVRAVPVPEQHPPAPARRVPRLRDGDRRRRRTTIAATTSTSGSRPSSARASPPTSCGRTTSRSGRIRSSRSASTGRATVCRRSTCGGSCRTTSTIVTTSAGVPTTCSSSRCWARECCTSGSPSRCRGTCSSTRLRQSIDPVAKRVEFTDGSATSYDELITTMPLTELVKIIDDCPDEVLTAALDLKSTSGLFVGIGVAEPCPSTKCWMYFPEDDSPFYRVTYLSNYSPEMTPGPGHFSLLAEVSVSEHKPEDRGFGDRADDRRDGRVEAAHGRTGGAPRSSAAS